MWGFKKHLFIFVLISLAFSAGIAHAVTCNPGLALSRAEWRGLGKIKQAIIIEPFANQSREGKGEWLSTGLAELLGDYLSAGKGLGVVKGIVRRYPPAAIQPDFGVTGSYQVDDQKLSVYINVYDKAGAVLTQASFTISPPNTGYIFTEMAKVVNKIAGDLKLNLDKGKFGRITGATSNYMAYEAYIRGLQAMWQFDPNYIDVANTWFDEAKKHDEYFQAPYIARANMYGYLAIQAKLTGYPYSQYLEAVERIENALRTVGDRPSPIPDTTPKIKKVPKNIAVTNRYLNGNAHYIAGIAYMQGGDPKKAKKELEEAAGFVPEDSVALRALLDACTQLGDLQGSEDVLKRMGEGMCY